MNVRTLASPTTSVATLPRVNLLPPEIAEARRMRQVKLGLGLAVLGSVAVVGVLYTNAAASAADARHQRDQAIEQQTLLQSKVNSLHDVTDTYNRVTAAKSTLDLAMGQEVRWSTYLGDLSLSIPDNVWLTGIVMAQTAPVAATTASTVNLLPAGVVPIGTVTFSGVALSHDDVASWLESLAKQKGFANPYFTSATENLIGGQKVDDYTSTVQITTAALSNRYASGKDL